MYRSRSIPITIFFLLISTLLWTIFGLPLLLDHPSAKAESHMANPHTEIQDWTQATSLPEVLALRTAVQVGDFVYIVGGRNSAGDPINNARSARIKPNGTLEAWKETLPLPDKVYLHATVASDTHIYVIGGWNGSDLNANVWRATLAEAGEISAWSRLELSPYPLKIDLHDAVIVNDRIYVMGGFDGSVNGTQKNVNTVYYAKILPDGIGQWVATTALPQAIRRHSVTSSGNLIYVTGGYTDSGAGTMEVYYTEVHADGSLGAWIVGRALPEARYYHSSVVHDGRLVVLGGKMRSQQASQSVLAAVIRSDGSLGAWKKEADLPIPLYRFAALSTNRYGSDYLFVIGGISGSALQGNVYYSTLPSAPTATPTPMPTATPTPVPELLLSMENGSQQWLAPGDDVEYIVSFRTLDTALANVQISAEVPQGTELLPDTIKSSNNAPFTFSGINAKSDITWQIGTLESNAQGSVSYRVMRPRKLNSETRILEIDVEGPATAEADEPISYTITLSNNSHSLPLSTVVVTSTLPTRATFLHAADSPAVDLSVADRTIVWKVSRLNAEAVVTLEFSVSAKRSIVFSNVYASALGGVRSRNESVVITKVADSTLPPEGDGHTIINQGATATWESAAGRGYGESNRVMNPTHKVLLPLIIH